MGTQQAQCLTQSARNQDQEVGVGKPCPLDRCLVPEFGLSSSTFQDGLRPHWTLLTTPGNTCLGLQRKPHRPRVSEAFEARPWGQSRTGFAPAPGAGALLNQLLLSPFP